MAYEMKNNQGSLFPNDKQNDRQPDWKGKAMVGGQLYFVSAWERTSQNGNKYMTFAYELPKPRTEAPAYQEAERRAQQFRQQVDESLEPQSDDLPF